MVRCVVLSSPWLHEQVMRSIDIKDLQEGLPSDSSVMLGPALVRCCPAFCRQPHSGGTGNTRSVRPDSDGPHALITDLQQVEPCPKQQ